MCDHVRSTYVESEEFRFGCKLTYSGREPNLKLTKHDKQFTEEEDDQIANSFDIGEMSLQYTNTLKPEDDGQTIVCTAKMDDVEEKCNVTLDVKCEIQNNSKLFKIIGEKYLHIFYIPISIIIFWLFIYLLL